MIVNELIKKYFGDNNEICNIIDKETNKIICFFMDKIFKKNHNYDKRFPTLEWDDLKTEKFHYNQNKDSSSNDIGTYQFNPNGDEYTLRKTGTQHVTLVYDKPKKKLKFIDTIIGKTQQGNQYDKRIGNEIDINFINVCVENKVWKTSEVDPCLNKDHNPVRQVRDICLNGLPCVFGYIGFDNLITLGINSQKCSLFPVRYGVCNTVDDIKIQLVRAIEFLIRDKVQVTIDKRGIYLLIDECEKIINKNIVLLKSRKKPYKEVKYEMRVIDDIGKKKYKDTIYLHGILDGELVNIEPIIFIDLKTQVISKNMQITATKFLRIVKIDKFVDNNKDFLSELQSLDNEIKNKFISRIAKKGPLFTRSILESDLLYKYLRNKESVSNDDKNKIIPIIKILIAIITIKIKTYFIDSCIDNIFMTEIVKNPKTKDIKDAYIKKVFQKIKDEKFYQTKDNIDNVINYKPTQIEEIKNKPEIISDIDRIYVKNPIEDKAEIVEPSEVINYNPFDIGLKLQEIEIDKQKLKLGNIYLENDLEWRNIYHLNDELYGRFKASISDFDSPIDIEVCNI